MGIRSSHRTRSRTFRGGNRKRYESSSSTALSPAHVGGRHKRRSTRVRRKGGNRTFRRKGGSRTFRRKGGSRTFRRKR